jgi:hypothetical protein
MKYPWVMVITMSIVLGCAGVKNHWKEAESTNTIAGYEKFLTLHPQSEFSNDARSKIQRLRFNEANQKDQILYYTEFLKVYPKGEYSQPIQASLNTKVKTLKSLQTKTVNIEIGGEKDIDRILLSTAKDLMARMGIEVVTLNNKDCDAELKIGKTQFSPIGATAIAGSPYIFLASTSEVTCNHRLAGAVFQEQVTSPSGSAVKLVEKGGRWVKVSPSDPVGEQKQIEASEKKLPIVFQTEIAEYFEKYLGKGMGVLLDALKSENSLLQEKAATSLGRLSDSRAIGPLIEVLAAKDKDVRKRAAKSLEELTGQKLGEDIAKWQDWLQQNKHLFLKGK